MRHCDKCKMDIVGERKHCPLCQSDLSGAAGNDEVFPYIRTIYSQYNFLFKLLIFLSVAAAVVSIAINLMVEGRIDWSLFVMGGILCVWLIISLAVRKRKNIPKTMLYLVVMTSVISVIWDMITKWNGWSIDFVVPIVCFSAMLAISILSWVMNWDISDIIVYFFIDAAFGIVPIIFYLTGILGIVYPSLICVAGSVISLVAMLVFNGEDMLAELRRRLFF